MSITAGDYFTDLRAQRRVFGQQNPMRAVLTPEDQRKIDQILKESLNRAPIQYVEVDENEMQDRCSCDLFQVLGSINVVGTICGTAWFAYHYLPWEIFKYHR